MTKISFYLAIFATIYIILSPGLFLFVHLIWTVYFHHTIVYLCMINLSFWSSYSFVVFFLIVMCIILLSKFDQTYQLIGLFFFLFEGNISNFWIYLVRIWWHRATSHGGAWESASLCFCESPSTCACFQPPPQLPTAVDSSRKSAGPLCLTDADCNHFCRPKKGVCNIDFETCTCH